MDHVMLYDYLIDTLRRLPDDTAGRLVKAILAYAREPGSEEDYLQGRDEQLLFPLLRGQIDHDRKTQENPAKTQENPTNNPTKTQEKPNGNPTGTQEKTQAKTQRRAESARENGKKGGRPKTQENPSEKPNENPSENPTSSSPLPPSSPSSPSDPSPCTPYPVSPITPYNPPLSTTTGDAGGGGEEDDGRTRDTVVGYAVDNLLTLSPRNLEELVSYKEDLPDDVICHAVDVALAQGKRTWSYVRAILNRYVSEGIKTIGEIKAQEDKRAAQNARSGTPIKAGANPALNYQQSEIRDEDLDGLFVDLDDVWDSYHGKESANG